MSHVAGNDINKQIMLVIIEFLNTTDGGKLALIATVYSVIMLIVSDIFVRFTMMSLKYSLTMLFVEYSTFRIHNYDIPIDIMHYCSRNLELK